MKNARVAFEPWGEGSLDHVRCDKKLVGYQEIRFQMIFEIKIYRQFTHKARSVVGGHTTNLPSSITYSSVVFRDSIIIALTLASLIDVEIRAADIGNAYFITKC